MTNSSDITVLLQAMNDGDSNAPGRLFKTLYDELHAIADVRVRNLAPNQTLGATAVVHEAYLRLADYEGQPIENRRHFLGIAGKAMRHLLIDHARAKGRRKRGGDRDREALDAVIIDRQQQEPLDLLALDDALQRLESEDPELVRLVEYRYFAGLSIDQTAELLDTSPSSVNRRWSIAKAWLNRELKDTNDA